MILKNLLKNNKNVMKSLFYLGMIMFLFSCGREINSSFDEESDEKIIFNKTIESLKVFNRGSDVFGQFNFSVKLNILKRVIQCADSTLTTDEIDRLCSEYYVNCSLSIHDLINDKNGECLVYRFPNDNVNVYGYPIIIGEDKAVTISYHHKFIRTHLFELYPVVLVYEKNDFDWKETRNLILNLD